MSDKRVDRGHDVVQVGWRIRSSGALFQSGNDDTDEVFASDPESYEPVFIVTESGEGDEPLRDHLGRTTPPPAARSNGPAPGGWADHG